MTLFDTHAHYDDARFDGDRDAVLRGLAAQGVRYVANIGCDMPSSRATVAMTEQYPFVYGAVGVHPHDAGHMIDSDLDELKTLLGKPKIRALGEIGLDYHYDFSPREVQQRRFRDQMALARELDVPVVIHEREAHEDCLNIVREFPQVRGVYHCYSGSVEMAKELVRRGYYLSFNGMITFPKVRRSHEVIAWAPPDRLMIETDCPYLAPVPKRGARNDSSLLPYVAQAVAAIRGISPEEAGELTTRNALAFYQIASD